MAILKAHASTQPASVRVITDASKKRRLGDYVREGIKVQMAEAAFVDELASWFRFSAQEAEATRDGLWMRAMGRPEGEREASLASFRVFGKDAVTRFEEAAVSLAPACVVLLSEENKAGWVEAGRLYQRLALELARHEVSFAFHNQPIEVPVLRDQFETEFQLPPHSSQLLLRVGKAPRLPASFRRKTGEVVL